MGVYDDIREKFLEMVLDKHWGGETIEVIATPLTPEEAIGNPEDRDYPILKGKERIMEARFRGAVGHAFTDMYGNFTGPLIDVTQMALENNFRRAVFMATLNAVMRYLKKADATAHCKDEAPRRCSRELVSTIHTHFGHPRVAMVGFQPRMIQALSKAFDIRVSDLDPDNIGKQKFGQIIEGPERTRENISWSDLCVVTGTTLTNGTFPDFLNEKPTIFYGVTISGVASLLNLWRFCPYGM